MTQIPPYPCSTREVEQRWQTARVPFAEFLRQQGATVSADLKAMFPVGDAVRKPTRTASDLVASGSGNDRG